MNSKPSLPSLVVSSIEAGDKAAAALHFNSLLNQKLQQSLDVRKVTLGATLFNKAPSQS